MNEATFPLKPLFAALLLGAVAGAPLAQIAAAPATARIVVTNGDDPGVGFNDTTPATPVGNNPGTTIGEQRMFVYRFVAHRWATKLPPGPPIEVYAYWDALTCTANSAVLGSAGTYSVWRDFPGAPRAGTWYSGALANTLAGVDLDLPDLLPEIIARFNVNLGQPGCLTGSPFYLGVDGNTPVGQTDFATVLLHELGHGLGFQALTDGSTGARIADADGAFPSQWEPYMLDTQTGKAWLDMTDTERLTSATNGRKVVWTGPNVLAAVPSVLQRGTPVLRVSSTLFPSVAGVYTIGGATFGPAIGAPAVRGRIARVIDTPASGTGLACAPLDAANTAAVAGRIALVDRGTCTFVVKAANLQNAGAIGMIVADNVADSPPASLGGTDPTITIPAARITQADGNLLKTALTGIGGKGVFGALGVDKSVRAGADASGRPMLYTPNPFSPGSSVSHWDTSAFSNLLMEPFISPDLTMVVKAPRDLTLPLLKDIGW